MLLSIDEVLSRLTHVKKCGANQWQSSCPCSGNHKNNDSTTSFRIRQNADGRIMVFCQTGCQLNEICDALGCKTTDLLPDKPETDRKAGLIKWFANKNGLKFVHEYSYCYGEYNDGLSKVRFVDDKGNKTFRWMKIDGSKASGYAFNREGCPDRLYFAGDPDANVVYLVEGEKDADTVHQLTGCTAASAENGATKGDAGAKWNDQYTCQLKNKEVYVLYDNDDSGRAWSKIEVQKLTGTASNVYVLDLPEAWPGCPDKGDITDAVEALGADKVKNILASLTASVKNKEPEPVLNPFDKFLTEIKTTKYRPVKTGFDEFDELLGGGILRQSLVVLLAAPSAGKSALCQQILEGMAEREHDVMYLNLEMSRQQMYARSLSRLVRKQGHNMSASAVLKGYSWTKEQREYIEEASALYRSKIDKHMTYNPDGCTTDIESIRETINEAGDRAREHDPESPGPILCVDYLHLVSSQQRDDGTEIIKKTVAMLKEYAVKYNTIVILISASNRASNATGSTTMESARDTSSIEYSGDYLLGLGYKAFDLWDGKQKSKPKLEELQQQSPRKMVLKLMKNRLDGSGRKIWLDFDAANSTFTFAGKPNINDPVSSGNMTEVDIDTDEIFDKDDAEVF